VPSKILHVLSGKRLEQDFQKISDHFKAFGSPIMMGGDIDASSKGIFGTCIDKKGDKYLLVVDPHFFGKEASPEKLIERGWVLWKKLDSFLDSSFYNLCLPQHKA
jgi:hypothetical protein